jgi:hypothetical protein
MKPTETFLKCLCPLTAGLALAATSEAAALPTVYRATATIYANITDPQHLAFAGDGTLYVGRDAFGSGGGYYDAVKIWRLGPGGRPVEEFGRTAIADPDAVIVDRTGAVSGMPGAVLVGFECSAAGTDWPRVGALTATRAGLKTSFGSRATASANCPAKEGQPAIRALIKYKNVVCPVFSKPFCRNSSVTLRAPIRACVFVS